MLDVNILVSPIYLVQSRLWVCYWFFDMYRPILWIILNWIGQQHFVT